MAITTISCTTKYVYLTPSIKGQVFDSRTGDAIVNQGIIFTAGPQNSATDLSGKFYLEAFKGKKLTAFEQRRFKQTIKFNFNGYEFKCIDYSNHLADPLNANQDNKIEVDIGKVYLDPKE